MAQTSWPFENIDTSETQFSQWARNIGEGVKVGSGDELEPYGDGSGMNVKVDSGQALIRGHYYSNSATVTLTVTAADPTNPRIDLVVLELDPSANAIVLKVIAGTPAGSPVAPALVQTDAGVYQLKIAEVQVDAGETAIGALDVTDTRPFLATVADKQDIAVAVSTKTAAYTLLATDTNDLVQVNGTHTITVPASVFATGTRVDVANIGTGVVTFAAGAGLTLSSKEAALTLDTQFAAATVFFTSATTALLVGDLA
jgi:hypothetical protein